MSTEPTIDFGSPTIFFDSHPSEQESYLYSYWSSLKSQLHIAWSGDVPKFHAPSRLRIIWYTHDGNSGMKDYELHEFALVRKSFDAMLELDEVRRVVVMGYSKLDPYTVGAGGKNMLADRFEKESRKGRMVAGSQDKKENLQTKELCEKSSGDESKQVENLIDL
jgi:hypothetical protein